MNPDLNNDSLDNVFNTAGMNKIQRKSQDFTLQEDTED